MSISISLIGEQAAISALQNATQTKEQRVKDVVSLYTTKIHNDAVRNAPADTSDLRRNIRLRLQSGGNLGEVYVDTRHGPHVEFGTKPHWPPPGALAGWARRNGVDEDTIRYLISIRGTPPQPYLTPAYDRYKDEFRRRVQQVAST